jgi:hypothetical protein
MSLDKPKVFEERINNLSKKLSKELAPLKGSIILGVFNDKIPVFLRMPNSAKEMLGRILNGESVVYRIHYDNFDSNWWISVGSRENVLFNFYIPFELKKHLANIISSREIVTAKRQYMSTLVFTYVDKRVAKVIKLKLDSNWVSSLLRD